MAYAENVFAAGVLPRTPVGELTRLPDPRGRLGRDTLSRPTHSVPSASRHSRLRHSGLPPVQIISGYATVFEHMFVCIARNGASLEFSQRQSE